MIVHVVSWSPSMLGDGNGGFEWREDRHFAISFLNELLATHRQSIGVNISLCVLDVPEEGNDAITRWIDENLHLVEPSLPS